MVRPSVAMKTASGAYMPIIALTLPELNRSTSVATMPSGSVGSEWDSDIIGLQFVRVEPVAVSSQGTCIVFTHRSAGRSFPMRCEYSFHSGGGTLLRRSSLPFVHRGELRDLPYLDPSGRSRDRRDHQFPLQRGLR